MKSPHSTTRSNKEIPSSTSSKHSATQQSSVFQAEKTGMYIRNWPEVYPAPTHFKRALRSLKHVSVDTSIKNIRNKERKYAAQQLDTLMKALTVPITQLITLYQFGFRTLHPFEQTVANLTITARTKQGHAPLPEILQRLQKLRAQTSRLAKDYAKRANTAESAVEAKALASEGIKRLKLLYLDDEEEISVFLTEANVVPTTVSNGKAAPIPPPELPTFNEFLCEAQALAQLLVFHQDLKRIPVLELKRPTVVLVGAPNVGKSSLVRAVSSGTPEVNDYPFTTRGVTIGHIYTTDEQNDEDHEELTFSSSISNQSINIDEENDASIDEVNRNIDDEEAKYIPAGKKASFQHSHDKSPGKDRFMFSHAQARYQVMDTPGLLHRPEEERNEMERLTYASLAQLPTAVLFVIDATELSGQRLSSLHDQLQIRQALKQRFPKRPWIDILSKSDVALTEAQTQMLQAAGIAVDSSDREDSTTPFATCLRVSVRTGENISLLRQNVRNMLLQLEAILQDQRFK
jgi:nucleolar GTP-binding protein